MLRLLRDHHFPEGQCQAEVKTSIGLTTRPDWLHEATKVAIYLDGMSKYLHADEKTAQRDQLIRSMLELEGFKVIVVQSKDLTDPQIVRVHLQNIAKAISRKDLAEMIEQTPLVEAVVSEVDQIDTSVQKQSETEDENELLEFVDERCRAFLKQWLQQGYPKPIVGFDLENHDGIIVAAAELAWVQQKVAAIFTDQDGREEFEVANWSVFDADTLHESIQQLAKALGVAK